MGGGLGLRRRSRPAGRFRGPAAGRVVRLRLGHRNPGRPDDPVLDPVARLQDRATGRLVDAVVVRVQERLVLDRVEPLAHLAELLQPELRDDLLQRLADRLEAALELAMLAGPADVVQDRQQLAERVGNGQFADDDPVPLHPLAVVGVLGLDTLQVTGALGNRRLERCHLRRQVRHLLRGFRCGRGTGRCRGFGCVPPTGGLVAAVRRRLRRLPNRARLGDPGHRCLGSLARARGIRRLPDRTRLGVDPAPVPYHRTGPSLRFWLAFLGVSHGRLRPSLAAARYFFSVSSSTISASTTSSSELAEAPASAFAASAWPSPSAPSAAACAWACAYSAVPIFWLASPTFSVADLIASTSSLSSAFFRSPTAASTSVLMSVGIFSLFSLRNFSVW